MGYQIQRFSVKWDGVSVLYQAPVRVVARCGAPGQKWGQFPVDGQ